ncbi:MAG: MFS transporter [Clostridia bacterium]|nr:MFS transporter [Clostridia bacterium]
MKITKHNINAVYTIFVFVALASLDNAVLGLFPPLFSSIAKDLNIDVAILGIVSATNILVTSISSIIWGYLADKGKRKRLIIIGTIVWSISVYLTAYCTNVFQLIIYQVFTGIGLGCIASIGFSVLTDYIPKKWRGMLMSLWGLSQGFGGIAGSVMASIVATATNWRVPFEVIAILGAAFIFLYFFIKEPPKGGAEPELQNLVQEGYEYNYTIELSHIKEILQKKSNKWLIYQGFFMNITTGTLIWLPTLYISRFENAGVATGAAIIAAGYLYALLQVGGLSSIYFGYLGDLFQKRSYKGRVLLSALCVFLAMPLYIAMFIIPMKGINIPDSSNAAVVFLALIREIVLNPWMLLMFFLAIGATAAQSANTPNWLALITDTNLPENRATTFSIANLVNGIGRAIGNVFLGIVLKLFTPYFQEPINYMMTMIFFQLFFLPSSLCYLRLSGKVGHDLKYVKSTLRRRAKKT